MKPDIGIMGVLWSAGIDGMLDAMDAGEIELKGFGDVAVSW